MRQLSFEDDFTVLQEERNSEERNHPDQSVTVPDEPNEEIENKSLDRLVTVPEGPPARSISSASLRDAVKRELRKQEQAKSIYIHKKLARKDDSLNLPLTIDEMLSVLRSILNGNQNRDRKLEEIRQWVKQWARRK